MRARRLCLGTTALAAAAFAANNAAASDPVKLGLGGFYRGAMGAVIGEDSGDGDFGDYKRGHAFKQDIEVYFLGETTLDNGLTVGARIELEGETDGPGAGNYDGDQIDAAYAYLEGGFGQIRFGDHAGAMGTMCETAPTASAMFGADSPSFHFSNVGDLYSAGTNGTCGDIAGKATKISYFSPDFSGFSFGVSYTPDDAEDNETPGSGTGNTDYYLEQSEILSLAANYRREFGEVALSVGLGWERAFDREHVEPVNSNTGVFDGINDYSIYRAHLSAGYGGFTIGGAWMEQRNLGLPPYSVDAEDTLDDLDVNVWSVGAIYAWDSYSVGLGYSYGRYDTLDSDVDHLFEDGEARLHIVSLTGSYQLGPGISLDGMVGYNDFSEDREVREDRAYDTFEVGFGLSIDF